MSSVIFQEGNKFTEHNYELEKDYESTIKNNAKLLFGPSAIYIDLKARISSAALGESIPDGVLFDLKRFYGGECATITVENDSNLDEVIEVLKIPIS